jgi:hypothetical protein
MATSRNIEVVYTIRDKTKAPLKKLKQNVKGTGNAAKTASMDFKGFNRTLFATTAFVATFAGAFFKLRSTIESGADFDRVNSIFERTFGHRGKLIGQIRGLTDAGIDQMQVMRSAMELQVAGVATNTNQLSRLFAMGAVAARRSGKESTVGIKKITEFLKSGSVQALQSLGVIRNTDARFTSLIEIMKKAGGVLGGTISTQAKMAFAMKALTAFTKNQMKGFQNLGDIVTNINSNFEIFGKTISVFIGKALSPIIIKLSEIITDTTLWFETVAKGNKNLMFLTKSVIATTAALGGLVLILGTLKLTTLLLGSVGIGIPLLTGAFVALAAIFTTATAGADSFAERLKFFGGILRGVWQLISSFDSETGFGRMSKELHTFLKNNGLLEFTTDIARAAILVKSFFEGMWTGVKFVFNKVLDMFDAVGINIREIFSKDNDVWQKKWIDWAKAFGTIVGGIGAALAPLMLFAGGKALLGAIPLIGGLLGGGAATAAAGTAAAASTAGTGATVAAAAASSGFFGIPKMFKSLFGRMNTRLGKLLGMPAVSNFTKHLGRLGQQFKVAGRALWRGNWKSLGTVVRMIGPRFALLAASIGPALLGLVKIGGGLLAAGAAGFALGTILTKIFPQLTKIGDWAFDLVNGDSEKKKLAAITSDQGILDKVNQNRKGRGENSLTMEEFKAGKARRVSSPVADAVKTPEGSAAQGKTADASESRVEEINKMLGALDKDNPLEQDLRGLVKVLQAKENQGGSKISPEEFEMFSKAHKDAINASDLTTKMKPNTGAPKRSAGE